MPFTRYEGERPADEKTPEKSITISKSGFININTTASEHFKNYQYVDLFYDKDEKKIALKPTNDKKSGTYTLSEQYNYDAYKISCKSFLKYYDISFDKTRKLQAVWEDDKNMLIASLENGEKVG